MILSGRYRLVRRIATGGMGSVHEAVDERLGRRVAVKILKEEYADDPVFVERFRREAQAVARLSHPRIAQVFDTGRDDGHHFIVMELVEGRHLGEVLREEGRLAPERATQVAAQVCSALAAAHAAGIVHRDIKPSNVIVEPGDQVKVTDFGIAQTKGQEALTDAGAVLGTAQYLSPEQASGQGATAASDIYATGVLLFQMLTGSVPFTDDSPVAVALRHVREEVPPVRDLAPDVPVAVARVVAEATAKDAQRRFAGAAEMEAALHDALAAPDASPTAPLPVAPADSKPRGALAASPRSGRLAAAALLLAGAVALGWVLLSPDQSSPGAGTTPAPSPQGEQSAPSSPGASSPQRTGSASPSPDQEPSGPVVPVDALGMDAKALEEQLKARGYDVHKVDIESSADKDAVVATIPGPGEALAEGQSVVLVASTGKPPKEPADYVVPDGLVGSNAKDAEELLKEHDIDVKKVDVVSPDPKDVVLASYPSAGMKAVAGIVVLAVSTGP